MIDTSNSPEPIPGFIQTKSGNTFEGTVTRLEDLLRSRGLTIFASINHTAGAQSAGLDLRPTHVFIFGNPRVGTLLMQKAQSAAIDLPLKMAVWENDRAEVWLGYNKPAVLAERHNLKGCETILGKITQALESLASEAAGI